MGRRLVRMAVEDIGLADPRALEISPNACTTHERLGSPEGELALARAAVFLACAAKSNAVYKAYNAAPASLSPTTGRVRCRSICATRPPPHEEPGLRQGLRYAHDEPDGYAAGENHYCRKEWRGPTGINRSIGAGGEDRRKLERLRELDRWPKPRARGRAGYQWVVWTGWLAMKRAQAARKRLALPSPRSSAASTRVEHELGQHQRAFPGLDEPAGDLGGGGIRECRGVRQ